MTLVAGVDFLTMDEEYDIFGDIYVLKMIANPKRWRQWRTPEIAIEYYETDDCIMLTQETTLGVVEEANEYFLNIYGIKIPEETFISLLDPIVQEYHDLKYERETGIPFLKVIK